MWSQTTHLYFGQLVRTALVGSLMRGAGGALSQCYAGMPWCSSTVNFSMASVQLRMN